VRRCRLRDEEAALHRCAQRRVDVRLRHALERLRHEPRRGGVDDHVEPVELGGRALDEHARLGSARQVGVSASRGENLPPGAAEVLDEA
jgi:hypothetical protein